MPSPIPARAADTTDEVERQQILLLRGASVSRRLRLALAHSALVATLARRAMRRADPDAAALDIDLRFVELHYGRELAAGLRADLARRNSDATFATAKR